MKSKLEDTDKNIYIKGARVNNLKNIDVAIPRNKLVVITGLSGSGKSSLAFDTLYAEGQRRYVESLSSYARQFMWCRSNRGYQTRLVLGVNAPERRHNEYGGIPTPALSEQSAQSHQMLLADQHKTYLQHGSRSDQPELHAALA